MFKYTKKGNIGIEATILLPFVILGILTIAFLIKVNCSNEVVISIASDEARKLSIETYTNIGKVVDVKFPLTLKHRLEEDTDYENIRVNKFRYLYFNGKIDNLISFNVQYKNNCNFPIDFYGQIQGNERITTRAFVGSDKYEKPKKFETMEEDEESEIVWIFPESGKRYHSKNCPYVRTAAIQTILTNSIKRKYKSCRICNSKNLSEGTIIYYFPNSGKVYHCANCNTVDKYIIEVEKSEAIRRGYTPCLKCGGE